MIVCGEALRSAILATAWLLVCLVFIKCNSAQIAAFAQRVIKLLLLHYIFANYAIHRYRVELKYS